MRPRATAYAAVMAGSALGAVSRYLCSWAAIALLEAPRIAATLAANVGGSIIIGFAAVVLSRNPRSRVGSVHRFLMIGFCGGLTTFSIFSLETVELAAQGQAGLAVANVLLALLLWIPGVSLGYSLGRRLPRR